MQWIKLTETQAHSIEINKIKLQPKTAKVSCKCKNKEIEEKLQVLRDNKKFHQNSW